MYGYRILEFSPEGRIAATTSFECLDDLAACQRAAHMRSGRSVEIWQSNRLVTVMGEPPNTWRPVGAEADGQLLDFPSSKRQSG